MSTEHDIGYGWTLKQENEEELEVVYITVYIHNRHLFFQPLKKGQKDTSFCPIGVLITEVPLCIIVGAGKEEENQHNPRDWSTHL